MTVTKKKNNGKLNDKVHTTHAELNGDGVYLWYEDVHINLRSRFEDGNGFAPNGSSFGYGWLQ